jgi:hypothetical protein
MRVRYGMVLSALVAVTCLVMPSAWAAEAHVMFTPDNLQWTDTPALPGAKVALIEGPITEAVPMLGIHLKRDSRSSIAYSEELISSTISATLQSTDRHHGIVGQKCCHFQLDS